MSNTIKRKVKGAIRLVRELVPAIRRNAGPKLRWDSLKEHGIVTVGDHTYGFPNVFAWNSETKLRIGKFCSIAEGVVFILGGEHRMDWITTYPFSVMPHRWPGAELIQGHPGTKGDIEIGNDVWIGHGALILSGIHVGDGAVIGAGAVVTKNVDNYAIVAGNPAKFVKYRFDEATRLQLMKMAWWDWSEQKISRNLDMLMTSPDRSSIRG